MKNLFNYIVLSAFLFFIGCSASTGTRYEEGDKTNNVKKEEVSVKEETKNEKVDTKNITEDFDITPYKTKIEVDVQNTTPGVVPPDVWYGYENQSINKSKTISGTTDGYRVQVISTDNLEKANDIRSEIYQKTQNKEVYISFEPPFYKVKVGDFINREEASDLKFKLNQLGYSEARIVRETINLFSE